MESSDDKKADAAMNTPIADTKFKYAGFRVRASALVIDSALMLLVTMPILLGVYGVGLYDYFLIFNEPDMVNLILTVVITELLFPAHIFMPFYIFVTTDFFINCVLPVFIILLFWIYRQATPGKTAMRIRIADAATGNKPSVKQYVIRYVAYFFSALALGMGFLWAAVDKRKQGWHDKFAKTVVVYEAR